MMVNKKRDAPTLIKLESQNMKREIWETLKQTKGIKVKECNLRIKQIECFSTIGKQTSKCEFSTTKINGVR